MALTYTNTSTRTYTRARMYLIRVQFQSFAVRFAYTPGCIEALPSAVEEQLVTSLTVYAKTPSDETVAAVKLRIDWVAHDEMKETTEVSIDDRWRDDVSPQLDQFEETFMDFVEEQGLIINRRIGLSDACRADPALYQATLERLDLVPGDPIQWKASPVGHAERIQRLGELSAEIQFADDAG